MYQRSKPMLNRQSETSFDFSEYKLKNQRERQKEERGAWGSPISTHTASQIDMTWKTKLHHQSTAMKKPQFKLIQL